MSNEAVIEKIETIQKKQLRYKLIFGSVLGVICLIYFFTFAMFVDKFPPIFFVIEMITAPIIFVMFFLLNRISFGLIKGGFAKQSEFSAIIAVMKHDDVDTKPGKIQDRLK
ncbi:MAG: hypothetical protein OEZ43_17355 [Gammaproteobacteria bacterium]|nr:hypothetical protein [Gammaproteobacteria bacterium]